MIHTTTTERSTRKMLDRQSGYWKLHYRWVCTCGQRGDWRPKKRLAEDGAAYHSYSKRAMTADEVRTMGDGMLGDLTREQAQARADRFNERENLT